RRHVFEAITGLDEAALRKAVLPSGWTPLGLIRHLALDDERFWFRAVVAGDQAVIDSLDGHAWVVGPDEPVDAVLEQYRAECAAEHDGRRRVGATTGRPRREQRLAPDHGRPHATVQMGQINAPFILSQQGNPGDGYVIGAAAAEGFAHGEVSHLAWSVPGGPA